MMTTLQQMRADSPCNVIRPTSLPLAVRAGVTWVMEEREVWEKQLCSHITKDRERRPVPAVLDTSKSISVSHPKKPGVSQNRALF